MNQFEAYDRAALYAKKHSRDRVCANCKHCYEASSFPQYDSCLRCRADNEEIYDSYNQSCPAFEFK